ncbi:MAG: YybH family protein [Alphaproteobacteria bacterium]
MMNSKFSCLAVAIFAVSACQMNPASFSPEDRAAIEAASNVWVDIYNRNDWEELSELFTPEATMMPPNGQTVHGREAIAAWERENETGFQIAFEIEAVEGRDDLAYVMGKSCVFIPDETGKFGVDAGKFLEIRKRQTDGSWPILRDIFNSNLPPGSDLLDQCPFPQSVVPTP